MTINPRPRRRIGTMALGALAGLTIALGASSLVEASAPPEVGTPLDPPVSTEALEFLDPDECHVVELDDAQQPLWFECTRVDEAGDVGIAYITRRNDPVAAWDWAMAQPDFNENVASLFYIQDGGFLYLHNLYGEMFDVGPWPDLHVVDIDCPPFPETFPGQGLCPDVPPTFPEDTAPADEPVDDPSAGFVMPDAVGMNLQDAQDLLQSASGNMFFYTSSVDASGEDRMQLMDSNWYVCVQNIPAGTALTGDEEITFAVVKTDEVCP